MSNSIGKLLLSSVSAATLCLSLASSAGAADRDGEIFARFFPWFEFGGVVGTDNSSRGEATFFVPLTQTHDSLFFTEWRGKLFEQDVQEVNAAFGYRRMLNNGYNLGVWIGADYRDTSSNNTFWQVSGGVEALSERYDFRANWYAPITGAQGAAGNGNVVFQAGNIFLVNGQEVPLYGADVEAGIRFALDQAMFAQTDAVLGVYAGGFYFDASDANQSVAGPRARFELSFENIAATMPGSKFTAEYEYSYDDVRKSKHEFGVRLRLPLGKVEEDRGPDAGQWRRMMAGLERDTDIVTDVVEAGLELTSDYHTGVDYLRAVVVNDNAGLVDALALGDGTLIIADGVNGAFEGGIEVGARQTLLGGMGDLRVVGVDTNRQATFNAPGMRPTFLGGVVSMPNEAFGYTSAGILLNERSKLQDVDVRGEEFAFVSDNADGDGFDNIQQVTFDDEPVPGSFQTTIGAGIVAIGDSAVAIDVDVDHVNNAARVAGIAWFGANGYVENASVGTVTGFEDSAGFLWDGAAGRLSGLTVDKVETFVRDSEGQFETFGLYWSGVDGQADQLDIATVRNEPGILGIPDIGNDAIAAEAVMALDEPDPSGLFSRGVNWTGGNGYLSNARIRNVEMATQASGVFWSGENGRASQITIDQVTSADFALSGSDPSTSPGDGDEGEGEGQDSAPGTFALGVFWQGSGGLLEQTTIGSIKSGSPEFGQPTTPIAVVGSPEFAQTTTAIGVGWAGEDGIAQDVTVDTVVSGNQGAEFGGFTNAGGFIWLGNNGTLRRSAITGGVSSGESANGEENLSIGLYWLGEQATVFEVSLGTITSGNNTGRTTSAVGANIAGANSNISQLTIGSVISGDGIIGENEFDVQITSAATGLVVSAANSLFSGVEIGPVRSGSGLIQSDLASVRRVNTHAAGMIVAASESPGDSGDNTELQTTVDGLTITSVATGSGVVVRSGGGAFALAEGNLENGEGPGSSSEVIDNPVVLARGIGVETGGVTIRNATVGNVTGGDVDGDADEVETQVDGLIIGVDAFRTNVSNLVIGDVTGGRRTSDVDGVSHFGNVSGMKWDGEEGNATNVMVGNIQSSAYSGNVHGMEWGGASGAVSQISIGDVTGDNPQRELFVQGIRIVGDSIAANDISFGDVTMRNDTNPKDNAVSGVFWSGDNSQLTNVTGGNIASNAARVAGILAQADTGIMNNVTLGNVTTSTSVEIGASAHGILLEGTGAAFDAIDIGNVAGGENSFGLRIIGVTFADQSNPLLTNTTIGTVSGHAIGLLNDVVNVVASGVNVGGHTGSACHTVGVGDTTGTTVEYSIGGGGTQNCP